MKKKKIIIFVFLTSLILIRCTNSDLIEIKDNVYLKKDDQGHFELIFDKDKEEEWVYKSVDSISVEKGSYGFLFYGISEKGTQKKWFYVAGAPLEFKKGFGNWYDLEFRKYRLKEMHGGELLYKELKSSQQIWNERAF